MARDVAMAKAGRNTNLAVGRDPSGMNISQKAPATIFLISDDLEDNDQNFSFLLSYPPVNSHRPWQSSVLED